MIAFWFIVFMAKRANAMRCIVIKLLFKDAMFTLLTIHSSKRKKEYNDGNQDKLAYAWSNWYA